GVHQHPQGQSAGLQWNVNHPESFFQVGEFREQLLQHISRVAEKRLIKRRARIVGIKGQIANRGFHEILEKVRPEGQLRQVISFLPRHLDQHAGVIDIGVGDGNAQFNISPASPAARSDENELVFGQEFVQPAYGAADIVHGLLVGQLAVTLEIDINNVSNVGHLAVGDEVPGGKNDFIRRQILRDGNGNRAGAVALRAALQQVEVLSVIGEFDIHRRFQPGLQQLQQLADAGHKWAAPYQSFESKYRFLRTEVGKQTDHRFDAIVAHQ